MFRRLYATAATLAASAAIIGVAALPAAAQPVASGKTAARTGTSAGPVTQAVRRYQIITHTGFDPADGTNATVRIKVYGFADTSPGYVNLDNDEDNFEPGKIDTFNNFQWPDLGGVDFIGVFKGNNGSDWRLLTVDVRDTISGAVAHCPTSSDPSGGYYPDRTSPDGLTIWFDCP